MPKFCGDLSKEDLVYISTLLDENKLFSEIFLDYNIVIPATPSVQSNW